MPVLPVLRVLARLVPLAAFALLAVPAHADPCNDAYGWFYPLSITSQFVVHGAAWDTTVTGAFPLHMGFDRTQRTLAFSAQSGGRAFARLDVPERFDVTGVPAGTPVPCTFELQLTGQTVNDCGGSGCGVTFWCTMFVGADSVWVDGSLAGPGNGVPVPMNLTLSLPATIVAGTPADVSFRVGYGTGPGAGLESGTLAGSYRVTGLPAGATAVSCSAGGATPVSRPTWGRLKSLYR